MPDGMPVRDRTVLLLIIAVCAVLSSGCRAIRRFGESRQAIAARRLSGQGFEAMHDGQWETAETLFSDALDVSKSDDRAHWGMAEACWNREQIEPAIVHMEQAVRLSAGDPRYVRRLGRMYLEVGRIEDANSHSQWALRTSRDDAENWALRGDCLKASGKPADALAAYHRALAYQPDFAEVQIQAADIYQQQQRFDRCLATIDRLQDGVGMDATPSRVDMLQGIAMRKLGRWDEAERCFLRASVKSPEDSAPHIELASLQLQLGQVDRARDSLRTAMKIDPLSIGVGGVMNTLIAGEPINGQPANGSPQVIGSGIRGLTPRPPVGTLPPQVATERLPPIKSY